MNLTQVNVPLPGHTVILNPLTVNPVARRSCLRGACIGLVLSILYVYRSWVNGKGLRIGRKALVGAESGVNRENEYGLSLGMRVAGRVCDLLVWTLRVKVPGGQQDYPAEAPHMLVRLTRAIPHTRQQLSDASESLWRAVLVGRGYDRRMARNPFTYDRDPSHDEDSEFGFGRGQHPDPNIDYSDGGIKSGIPIADPDQNDQLLTLRQIRRMDINDPNDQPSPYVEGNTDRYGAQPPLVRERKRPRYTQPQQKPPSRMKRSY